MENPLYIIITTVVAFMGLMFYHYIYAAIINVNVDQSKNVSKIIQEVKITEVYQEIMNNLEEGIILFRANTT